MYFANHLQKSDHAIRWVHNIVYRTPCIDYRYDDIECSAKILTRVRMQLVIGHEIIRSFLMFLKLILVITEVASVMNRHQNW